MSDDQPAMIVERDALRFMAGLGSAPGPYESTISLQQQALVRAGLKAGRHVISSDTNLAAKYVKELAKIGDFFGAEIEVIDVDTPLELCILRDGIRGDDGGHSVGADVIRRTYDRYFIKGRFPANPLLNREQPAKLDPYEPDTNLAPAYIFDIDGTVASNINPTCPIHGANPNKEARCTCRSPYDYTKVFDDLPHEDVLELASELHSQGNKIIFLSGRDGSCVEDTVKWIEGNSNFHVGTSCFLFMRPAGDKRADYIVKYELFTKHVAPYFYVKGVFDDRDQVVDFWRRIELRCYQVNYGDF
jgi:hypothetical protein